MKKILIDPHHCTREEYDELRTYLEEKSWDWRLVQDHEVVEDSDREHCTKENPYTPERDKPKKRWVHHIDVADRDDVFILDDVVVCPNCNQTLKRM